MNKYIKLTDAIAITNQTGAHETKKRLKELPGEDVKPVIRMKWVGVTPLTDSLQCSNCGYCVVSDEFITPYCPWCGARMEVPPDEQQGHA